MKRVRPRLFREALSTVWAADPRGTVLAGILQITGALSGLAVVLASKFALEAILDPQGGVRAGLVVALALLAGATAASSAVGVVQSLQQRLLVERVDIRLWDRLLRASIGADLFTWQSSRFVSRMDRVRTNALSRPFAVVSSFFRLTGSLVGTISLLGALLSINPLLVPVLLAAGIPTIVIARVESRREYDFAVSTNDLARETFYLKALLSSREYAAEIRAFDSGPHLLARHAACEATYLDRMRRHLRVRQYLALVSTGSAALALTLTLVLILVLVDRGDLTLPEAGAAAIAARLLGGQLGGVFGALSTLIESGPFLDDMSRFFSESIPLTPPATGRELRTALSATSITFRYEGRDEPVIDDVSITVPRGKVVALVGENGSGKSTLAKIVAGLYEPQGGSVSWDGDRSIAPHELRAGVSVLFQDFVRYQMTASDNITIADTSSPEDLTRLHEATRRADIDTALRGLPEQYDTMLGLELAEGSDLSGGQWQRLALARAFYRDSAVIVLDEPTAALDPQAEHDLFVDVRDVLDGRAALLISHRYSSVRLADYIYVLHEGRVVEEGSHEQLMEHAGRYSRLFTMQAAQYL